MTKKKKGVTKKLKVFEAAIGLGVKVNNPKNALKFLKNGAKGKGWLFPGSKYIGPGNEMNKGLPTSSSDAAARDHDLEYGNYLKRGVKPKHLYKGFSDADERLIKRTKPTTPEGLTVQMGMRIKKAAYKAGLTGSKIRDEPGDEVVPNYDFEKKKKR